jgi:hypothetical protein
VTGPNLALFNGEHAMRSPIPALLATLVLATSATTALAQDVPAPVKEAPVTLTKIDFPGGTMAEYTALLRKTFPDASIILMPGTEDFAIPSIKAQIPDGKGPFAPANVALQLVCGIPGALVFPATAYNKQEVIEGYLELSSFGQGGQAYRIEAIRSQAQRQQSRVVRSNSGFGEEAQRVQVWPLVDLTDSNITMEKILGTLKVAFELGEGGAPTLRYHEPTSILFVKGTKDQLYTVESTLEALSYVANDVKEDEISKIWAKDDEINKLKKEIENLKRELHKTLGKDSPLEETNENADSE